MTLTNWVRQTNAPLLLPRASAVQWNDYVFVLASDGTALLYHAKHGMWSMLPKCPIEQLEGAPPITVHKGEVITLSDNKQASFHFHLGDWKTQNNTFQFLEDLNHSSHKTNKIVIASLEGSLYAIVQWTEESDLGYNYSSEKNEIETTQHCDVLQSQGTWKTICRIRKEKPQSFESFISRVTTPTAAVVKTPHLESAAIVGTTLYVRTDEQLWKVALVTEEEDKTEYRYTCKAAFGKVKTIKFLPVSHCSKPPHPGSTIHAVKNSLFSFGGRDEDYQPMPDVLRYNPDTDTWESAGYMRSCRYNATVATMSQAENLDVIVIGGSFGGSQYVMKPRLYTETKTDNKQDKAEEKVISEWEDATSIVERCAVE